MSHATPDALRTVAFPVKGMDCMECTQHVQQALCTLPGVAEVRVSLSSEKAIVRYDPAQVDMSTFRKAVEGAGYTLPRQTVEVRNALSMCSMRLPLFRAWKMCGYCCPRKRPSCRLTRYRSICRPFAGPLRRQVTPFLSPLPTSGHHAPPSHLRRLLAPSSRSLD